MKEKKYAPVIIPTLCRFEHFRDCLESLSKCTWAEKTDVYIGLDYPAKETHWDGYKKIKEYLKKDKTFWGFNSLFVVEREHNYGFGPQGNARTLIKEVLKKYDRIIVSEDDNIFSPNFLVFMNRGLEKFKDDESVLALNGYRHYYSIKYHDNTFFRQNVDFSAWGYGIWKDRLDSIYNKEMIYFQKNWSIRNFFRIRRDNGNNRARDFFYYAKKAPRTMYDCPLSVYMYLENMNVIVPAEKSLVRNMGFDGSGLNCKQLKNGIFESQPISTANDFEFVGTGYEFYNKNRKIYRKSSRGRISTIRLFLSMIKIILKTIKFE